MTTHQFKIHAPVNPRHGWVEIDGRRIDGLVRVSFDLTCNGPQLLRLEIVGEVAVEGEFRESAILSVRQANSDRHGE